MAAHGYGTQSVQRFKCLPGDYTLYVAANLHRDLGLLDKARIEALTCEYKQTYDDLVMSAVQKVNIPAPAKDATVVTLPDVVVERCVAKAVCNISPAASSGISIESVQLLSIPRTGHLFGSAMPSAQADHYTAGPSVTIPKEQASRYSCVLYMPENRQGTLPMITTQQERTPTRSPRYATYLLIRAVRGSRVLAYTVYLGQNTTDDFNVRRNQSQSYNITLHDNGDADTRLAAYDLSVAGDFSNNAIGDYCTTDGARGLHIEVEDNTTGITFSAAVNVTSGDAGAFSIDNHTGGSHSLELYNPTGINSFAMSYLPKLITHENNRLAYTVTLRDSYGFERQYDFSHTFANRVTAAVTPAGCGTIAVDKALASVLSGDGEQVNAAVNEFGATFRAVAKEGYRFAGWYADKELTKPLTTTPDYAFKPTATVNSLYARFERTADVVIITDIYNTRMEGDGEVNIDDAVGDYGAYTVPYNSRCTITVTGMLPIFKGWFGDGQCSDHSFITDQKSYTFTAKENCTIMPGFTPMVNLSDGGTANCYIVPINTGAWFDSRYMGNGKATTGITPKTIYGSAAKVIWESGSVKGDVIAGAQKSGSGICLKTGTKKGNAVIGLFDANGVCVWSWHIWVTDYDPESSEQVYKDGYVLMDRNLGALNLTPSDPASRGLYFQWGRKDPFIHPATTTSATAAATVCGEGFEQQAVDPEAVGGERTTAWATAHPWCFIKSRAATSDWLSAANHNLWGNACSGTAYTAVSAKSIYDPCPVGWRVPHGETFSNAALTCLSTNAPNSVTLQSGNTILTYPLGGYINNGMFKVNGSSSFVWTNAPAASPTNIVTGNAAALGVTAAKVTPKTDTYRSYALPVRCVKE